MIRSPKRIARSFLFLIAVASLAGCATMYKSLGIATTTDLEAHGATLAAKSAEIDARAAENQSLANRVDTLEASLAELRTKTDALAAEQAQLAQIQAKIEEIQANMATMSSSIEDFARVSKAVDELKAQVALIPDETLKRLVDILSQAIQASNR